MEKKLAVFFPGIGYTVDKPLMYFGRKLAAEQGYEIKLLPYSGFPEKIRGNRDRMKESYQIAAQQTQEMMSDVDPAQYDRIVFVGKSIGTIVAAGLAADPMYAERTALVLYTPLEETFSFPLRDAVVFTGSADPWVGGEKSRISALSARKGIPCFLIDGGNHSLETGDALKDIANLQKIMEETRSFLTS